MKEGAAAATAVAAAVVVAIANVFIHNENATTKLLYWLVDSFLSGPKIIAPFAYYLAHALALHLYHGTINLL